MLLENAFNYINYLNTIALFHIYYGETQDLMDSNEKFRPVCLRNMSVVLLHLPSVTRVRLQSTERSPFLHTG